MNYLQDSPTFRPHPPLREGDTLFHAHLVPLLQEGRDIAARQSAHYNIGLRGANLQDVGCIIGRRERGLIHSNRIAADGVKFALERAAVLGANDGIVSISSLIVGVATATPSTSAVLIAGGAGLAAGAMSMAAGDYVSVSSQADIEQADIARETAALRDTPEAELAELVSIWEGRGLSAATAALVASELTHADALGTHVRDELGLSEIHSANPLQAALASGLTFTLAGVLPMLAAVLAPSERVALVVTIATLLALAGLGALGAWAGGAKLLRPTLRVVFWGAAAMAVTALIGKLFGIVL